MITPAHNRKRQAHHPLHHELLRLLKALPAAIAIAHLVLPAPLALANPGGAQVMQGQALFEQSGNRLDITNSPGAVLHWQDFSIGGGEVTQFLQQNANSAVLNRVVGPHLSDIQGRLQSNGKVFLINPNGIAVGAGAVIDTQGFVASTLNMSDEDFRSGRLAFGAAADADGAGAAISNAGLIVAHQGDVLLVAPRIENSGVIQADNGDLLLAAGRSVLVADVSLEGVAFELQAPDDTVLNLGTLLAGGTLAAFAGTLTHTGVAEASAVSIGAGGEIILAAAGDLTTGPDSLTSAPGGTIRIESGLGSHAAATTWIGGSIDAGSAAGSGGNIDLLGPQVGLAAGSVVSADGATGGGAVHVGGNYLGSGPLPNSRAIMTDPGSHISASATHSGSGGEVILWSDAVSNVHGAIAARGADGRGGFVETSSKGTLTVTSSPDIGAASGVGGQWLLDPAELTVTPTAGDANQIGTPPNTTFQSSVPMSTVGVGQITAALTGAATVTLRTTGLGDGVIDVNAIIDLNDTVGSNTLIFDALGGVNLNGNIQDRVPGGQTLNLTFQAGGPVSFNALNLDTQGGVIDVQIANGGTGAASINTATTISAASFMASSLAVNANSTINALLTLTDSTSLTVASATTLTLNNGVNLSNNVSIGPGASVNLFGGDSTLQDGTSIGGGGLFFFSVDPATLTIADGASVAIDNFRMSAGDLFQNGTLTIASSFNFQGGEIIGDSIADGTIVLPGAVLTMDGAASKVIDNHTLVHGSTTATSEWTNGSGPLILNNNAIFRNDGIFLLSANSQQVAGNGTFANTSTGTVNTGGLFTGNQFTFNSLLINDGSITAFDSDLIINAGGSSDGGTFEHAQSDAPGSGFRFQGGVFTLQNGAVIVGNGSSTTSPAFVEGGTLQIGGGASSFVELLNLDSGTLNFQDNAFLDVGDALWSGGVISADTVNNQLVQLSGGSFDVTSGSGGQLLDRARILIQGDSNLLTSFGMSNAAVFQVDSGATATAFDAVTIGSGGSVINDGTFTFSGSGIAPLTIQAALVNNNQFNVTLGQTGPGVLLTGGGVNSTGATIDIAPLASLTVRNNVFGLQVGSLIQNTGPLVLDAPTSQLTLLSGGTSDVRNVLFSNGLIDGPGQTRIQGNLAWSGGTVSTPSGISVVNTATISNSVTVDAGNVSIFGSADWTGGDIALNNAGEILVIGVFNLNAGGQSIIGDTNPASRVRNFFTGGVINVNAANVTLDAVLLNETAATVNSGNSGFRITRAGSADGTFTAIGSGADITFDFTGNYALNGATFSTDVETIKLAGGTFDVGGGVATIVQGFSALELLGGNINVQAASELTATTAGIIVNAPTSFTGGGTTRIAAGGLLTINNNINLNGGTIEAGGNTPGNIWTAGTIVATNDGFFTIPVGGDFNFISSTGLLFDYGNAGGTGGLNIDGRLFTGGSTGGVITIDVPTNITGTLDATGSANIALTRGGVSVMPVINLTGGELLFNGGTHVVSGPLPGGIFGSQFARVQGGTLNTTVSGFGIDRLAIEGGTVQADIGLTASTDLVWTGGTISGSNSVVAAVGATVDISGGNKSINAGTLDINSTGASWSAGTITAINDGFVNVNAGALLNLSNTVLLDYGNAGGTGGVNVTGTLLSTATSATIDIPVNVTSGNVTAEGGTLELTRGGSGNNATYATGMASLPALRFNGGTHDLAGTTTFSSPFGFPIEVAGGTVILQGASSANVFSVSGGSLDTRSSFDVQNFSWTGGTLTGGTGATNVTSTVTLSGGGKSLNNGRLRLGGANGTWDSGDIVATNNGFFDINGDLTVSGDVTLDYGNAGGLGALTIEESGRLIGNTANFTIDIPLTLLSSDGNGVVRVDSGLTRATRGSAGASRGEYAANGGDFAFAGGTHVLQSFTDLTSTGGDVIVAAGTVTTQAGTISADRLLIDGGTLNQDTGSMIDVSVDFGFNAGTLGGSGGASGELRTSGTATLTSAGTKNINGGNLNIVGSGLWDAGTVVITNDGFLRVDTTGLLNVIGDLTLDYGNAGGFGGFEVAGSVGVTTSPTSFVVDVPLLNNGLVDVLAGTVRATRGGDSSGSFNTASGRFEFNGGTHTLRNGTTFTGGGAITERSAVTAGIVNVESIGNVSGEFFEVSGGTFSVDGVYNNLNSWRWLGGTVDGAGSANVQTGTITIDGPATKTLAQLVLDIQTSGANELLGSGVVNLNDGSTLRVSGALALNGSGAVDYGNVGAVGTLDIISLANVTRSLPGEIVVDANFNSAGTLQVDDGTVRFTRGGTLGSNYLINAPGLVRVTAGTFNLVDASITGSGFFALEGGTITLPGSTLTSANNIRIAGGTLQGDGNLDLLTRGEWTGGILAGTGILRNAAGSILELSSAATKTLQGTRTLQNDGNVSMLDTGTLSIAGSATLINNLNWDVGSDANLDSFSGTAAFNNFGTFSKSAGSGATLLDINLTSTGLLTVASGNLQFSTLSNLAGANTASGTGAFRFTGGTHTLQDLTSFTGGAPTVLLEGGTLNLLGTTGIDSLLQTGGTLDGQNLSIANSLDWRGGTQQGAGTTLINSLATLVLSTAATKTLQGTRTLQNDGAVTMLDTGTLSTAGTSTMTNNGSWDIQSDANIDSFSGTAAFDNFGTFTKSAGAGATLLDVDLLNVGTFSVSSGEFQLATLSDLSGTMNATGSGLFRFSGGTHVLQDGSTFAGNAVVFQGGTVNLLGTTSVAAAQQSGGTLGDAGTLRVTSSLDWSGGTQQGSGSTLIDPGATLTLTSAATKTLTGTRTLNNNGSVVIASTGTLSTAGTASLVNNGNWDIQADADINSFSGTTPFANVGTLTKSAGAGTTVLDINLNNTGTFSISSGDFLLTTASTLAGSMNATGSGRFRYTGGSHALVDGSAFSGNAVRLEGGILDLLGTTTFANFDQTGAVLRGNTANVSGAMTWQGGTQEGTGSTLINPGASLTISGATTKVLQGTRTLQNAGTTDHAGSGALSVAGTAGINNSGIWLSSADNVIAAFSGTATFANSGTFTKSAGMGDSRIALLTNNSNAIAANSGTLTLTGGGNHTGTFAGAGGGIVFGGGIHNLGDGSVLTGTTPFTATGNSLNLTGTTSGATLSAGASLNLDNQNLGGAGNLSLNGTLQLERAVNIAGNVLVRATGVLDGRANGSPGTFQVGTLTNDGTVRLRNVAMAPTATALSLTVLNSVPLINRGLFEVSGVGGTRTVSAASIDNNGGSIDLQTGVNINATAAQSRIRGGGMLLSSGANSTFTSGTAGLTLEDTSVLSIGAGRVFTVDGNFDFVSGTLAGAGELAVINGNFNLPGAAARSIAGQTVSITNTTLAGGGSLAVDGGTLNLNGTTTINPGTTLALNSGQTFLGGPLNNNGRFEVNAGTFTINVGGTSSGEFAVSGANLVFAAAMAGPGNTLADGATLSGGGTITVTGNGLDITALTMPVDLAAGTQLQLNGATINGGGAINATGSIDVTGNSTGGGIINVMSNTLTVNTGSALTVDLLNNTSAGTVRVPQATGTAVINTASGFNNDGLLDIAAVTNINGPFTTGPTGRIVQTAAGNLTLDLGGAALEHFGSWNAGPSISTTINNTSNFMLGGDLALGDASNLTQNGGTTTWTGTSTITLLDSVVNLAGAGLTVAAPGTKQLVGGTLTSASSSLAGGAALQISGGAALNGVSLNVASGADLDVTDSTLGVTNTSVDGALRAHGTSTLGGISVGTGGSFETVSTVSSALINTAAISNAGNIRLDVSRSGAGNPQLTFASLMNTGTVTAMNTTDPGMRVLNGPVTNNSGGTLASSAGAPLAINGNLTNAGTVRADGADVAINGSMFSNAPSAVLTGLNGGQITQSGTLAINGSTVNANLTAAAINVTGPANVNGALNSAALNVSGGANVNLSQGGSAGGAITVGSASSLTFSTLPFTLNDGATLTGGGTFTLGSAVIAGTGSGVVVANGTTAAFAGPLAGNGRLTVNGMLNTSGASSFAGDIVVDSTGTLRTLGGGSLLLGNLDNRGLLRLGNAGSTPTAATLAFSNLTNSGELRIEAGAGGTRTVTGGFTNSGIIRVVDTRVDFNAPGATLANSGQFIVEGANGFVALGGATALANSGSISLAAGAHLGLVNGEFRWTGGAIDGTATSELVIGDTLRVTGAGTRTLSAPVISNALVVDAGTVLAAGSTAINASSVNVSGGTLNSSGMLGASSLLAVNAGGVLGLANATVTTGMLDVVNGTLAGTGTINGNLVNQGVVSVGNSPGILTVAGNYQQTASGTLVLEIGGTPPFEAGINFDLLDIRGSAAFDGILRVVEIPGSASLAGANISPIRYASATGAFSSTEVQGRPGFAFTGTFGPTGFGVSASQNVGAAVRDALGENNDPSSNPIDTSQRLAELADEQQDLEGCDNDDSDQPEARAENEHGVGCR